MEVQAHTNNTDCPRSGCKTSNKTIIESKINDKRQDKFKLFIQCELIIFAAIKMKKGFINSIG